MMNFKYSTGMLSIERQAFLALDFDIEGVAYATPHFFREGMIMEEKLLLGILIGLLGAIVVVRILLHFACKMAAKIRNK